MTTRMSLLAVLILTVTLRAGEAIDTAKVEEQARALGKAFLKGDWTTIVDRTYPKVIEVMGGKEKATERIREEMKQIEAQGLSFKSFTVGKAQAPVVDRETVYVVVPTSLEIAGGGSRVATDSYLLGVSTDGGKTWTFGDGTGMSNPAMRKLIFPNLPPGLKLPERKPPKITKE